jgi:hypothetical protein
MVGGNFFQHLAASKNYQSKAEVKCYAKIITITHGLQIFYQLQFSRLVIKKCTILANGW